ncbi:fatty acid desaturase [Natronospirillum operosum]|uniref:Fatty acid desaturase n=1 Tax=Natronospirillum operosum TaxID=2759953 RepID=A0A4Z0WAK6_9GAMM|nr:fatty acid desaturase [Natronospirillum operosum]TGG95172.1 fatty acid desaturase [Natronospirillum operosum]
MSTTLKQQARQEYDYSLTGPQSEEAVRRGLASANWHRCDIDRKTMKQLMQRRNGPALRHLGLWLVLLIGTGVLAIYSWGTWWALPAFMLYGVLYCASDHIIHEMWHGTPFRTRWLNTTFMHLTGFMCHHEAIYWRWSHARHHTDTLIQGRDREITATRPPSLAALALELFYLHSGPKEMMRILRHAAGSVSAETREIVPAQELPRMYRASRIYVALWLLVLGASLYWSTLLPLLLVMLPRFYGGPLAHVFNLTQHAGLPENVLDHRLNCRTVRFNPVFGFLYMNMQYHLEHHMFPMVPFHQLPQLHEQIKGQCPPPYPSLLAAYREIIPVLLRQRQDPTWFVSRQIPDGEQIP